MTVARLPSVSASCVQVMYNKSLLLFARQCLTGERGWPCLGRCLDIPSSERGRLNFCRIVAIIPPVPEFKDGRIIATAAPKLVDGHMVAILQELQQYGKQNKSDGSSPSIPEHALATPLPHRALFSLEHAHASPA